MEAHRAGFAENIYLDPSTHTYVEETGGANVLFVDKDNNLIVPKSNSILPSVTRRSLVYVGEHYLGLKVIERQVKFSEVKGHEGMRPLRHGCRARSGWHDSL